MRRVLRISLLALLGFVLFKPAFSQVMISVNFAPPALPVYEQPACPEDGWIWVPGYWAWDDDGDDYYWVPGTWVAAPEPGYLWTPPWWGWEDGAYMFHDGYWATEVGFYGGVNYGFGYFGHGFDGGRWDHDRFFYNTAVVNVNTTVIRNVYIDKTVIVNNDMHVSYNGGEGGIQARPTPREEQVAQMRHVPPPPAQTQRREMARSNPQMRASANQGRPPVAATARPTEFSGHGVVAARSAGAPYHPPANRQQPRGGNARPGEQPQNARPEAGRPGNEPPRSAGEQPAPTHARDLPPHQAPAAPEGNSAADRKAQQKQEELIQKQNEEHQRLAQKQQQEDQRAQQQHYNQQRQQQMEQRHQQQTQQMEQRHQQQQQRQQPRQPQPPPRPKEPRQPR